MPPDYFGSFVDKVKELLQAERAKAEEDIKTAFAYSSGVSASHRFRDNQEIVELIDKLLPQLHR